MTPSSDMPHVRPVPFCGRVMGAIYEAMGVEVEHVGFDGEFWSCDRRRAANRLDAGAKVPSCPAWLGDLSSSGHG